MAVISQENAAKARVALGEIVDYHGPDSLSDPVMMSNMLQDLLPEAPSVAKLLVAAAEERIGLLIRDHVERGVDAATAIRLAASVLANATLFTPDLCTWVAGEYATALGYPPGQQAATADAPSAAINKTEPRPEPARTVIAGSPRPQPAPVAPPGPATARRQAIPARPLIVPRDLPPVRRRRNGAVTAVVIAVLALVISIPVGLALAHGHPSAANPVARAFKPSPGTTRCGGDGCAIAYSPIRSTAYFGGSSASTNGDGVTDTGVLAQAAALTKCYRAGASDCTLADWAVSAYVSIAIDAKAGRAGHRPWGTGWSGTASASEEEAKHACAADGGTSHGCLATTEYSDPSPSQASSGSGTWGELTSRKYAAAIVRAYRGLGTDLYPNDSLDFAESTYGWTNGGTWAYPPATSAAEGYSYLKRRGQVHSPSTTPKAGDLVWFGASNKAQVGIYLGGLYQQFITSTVAGTAVFDISYWNSHRGRYEGFTAPPSQWLH